MKKYFALFAAAATVLVAAVSCVKENLSAATEEEQMVEMTVIASEKPESPAALQVSRTYLEGTKVKWSETGEKIRLFELATPDEGEKILTPKISSTGVISDDGLTMSFSASFSEVSSSSFTYYSVYPSSAYNSHESIKSVQLVTPVNQTPSATSFDASADLLIAKPFDAGRTQGGTFNMQYARMVAIGKMTVKNLGSTESIERITFTAKNGDASINLTGRTAFDLETGLPVSTYASNVQNKSIILNYSGQGITANSSTGMVAYFISYPFSLATGDSFKVEVETATQIFTKEVNLSGEQKLVLKEGKSSVFSVDMNGISGVSKISITSDQIATLSGVNGYGNSKTATIDGYRWESTGYRPGNSSAFIQLNNTASSYIQLPVVPGTIEQVVLSVTSSSANSESADETNAIFSFYGRNSSSPDVSSDGTSTNHVVLKPTLLTYRNGFIRSSGSARIWSIVVYYKSDDSVVSSVTITQNPSKLTYSVNEELSVFDGEVLATYSNSSVAEVHSYVSHTGSTASEGDTSFSVSFEGKTDTYSVSIAASDISWARVSSVNEILSGGTFIVGYEATPGSGVIVPMQNTGREASTTKDGYIYSGVAAETGNGTITMSEKMSASSTSAYEVSIEAGSVVGTIAIKLGDSFIGCGTNSSGKTNSCRLFTDKGERTDFTPTISDGVVTLQCLSVSNEDGGASYNPKFQYYSTNPRFTTYWKGAQKNIVLFKKGI